MRRNLQEEKTYMVQVSAECWWAYSN